MTITYLVGIDGGTHEANGHGNPEDPSAPLTFAGIEQWTGPGSTSHAGERVTAESSLTYSPIWQGVHLISGDVAKLPIHVFRRGEGSAREVDYDHPADRLISPTENANEEINTYTFWRRFMVSALLWGGGYAWIDRRGNGDPIGLYNLLPDRTMPLRAKDGSLWFVTEYYSEDGAKSEIEAFPAHDILYVEGISLDSTNPCEMVAKARQDIGLALAARKFTSRFFAQGAQHGGILQAPPGASQEAVNKMENALHLKYSGGSNSDHAFKTLILRDGFRWFSTSVDPDKAQLIELDEAQVRHAARWLNLAPEFLGVASSVSYNSLESRKQGYLDSTLSHWLAAIKAACNQRLRRPGERQARTHFIDYNINALLWADAKTRSEIAEKGILSGRFSVDETRAWENMNPRTDGRGHHYLQPLNSKVSGEPDADSEE